MFAAAANQTTTRPGSTLSAASETPLSDDDRDILAGISVMLLAIANRQNLAEQDIDLPREEDDPEQPHCGTVAPDASGSCVREVGHSGRHEYRPLNGSVN